MKIGKTKAVSSEPLYDDIRNVRENLMFNIATTRSVVSLVSLNLYADGHKVS